MLLANKVISQSVRVVSSSADAEPTLGDRKFRVTTWSQLNNHPTLPRLHKSQKERLNLSSKQITPRAIQGCVCVLSDAVSATKNSFREERLIITGTPPTGHSVTS